MDLRELDAAHTTISRVRNVKSCICVKIIDRNFTCGPLARHLNIISPDQTCVPCQFGTTILDHFTNAPV